MSFACYSRALEALRAACAADTNLPAPQARLLCDGLEVLSADSLGFTAVLDAQNPFYLEFIRYLEQGCLLEEDGLALLECLVIFFSPAPDSGAGAAPNRSGTASAGLL